MVIDFIYFEDRAMDIWNDHRLQCGKLSHCEQGFTEHDYSYMIDSNSQLHTVIYHRQPCWNLQENHHQIVNQLCMSHLFTRDSCSDYSHYHGPTETCHNINVSNKTICIINLSVIYHSYTKQLVGMKQL